MFLLLFGGLPPRFFDHLFDNPLNAGQRTTFTNRDFQMWLLQQLLLADNLSSSISMHHVASAATVWGKCCECCAL